MNKLLIATRNAGKFEEISRFLSDLPLEMVSLSDLSIFEEIEETGKTYEENSEKKAKFFAKLSGFPTIADDGGIEIDALGSTPGVRSRRWLGHEASDEELIEHMIKISKELPKNNRKARFIASLSFALPNGKVWSEEGKVEGVIALKPHLKLLKGYPYRSFFYIPKIKKYYHESELTKEDQKRYNHRYRAIMRLKPIIARTLRVKDYSDKERTKTYH